MSSAALRRNAELAHTNEEPYSPEGRALCPVIAAVGVIGTTWRLAVVHRLLGGPLRFSELLHSNPKLNAKTLSATLKFLEANGVVRRNVVSTRPFMVVYALTEMGQGLAPISRELQRWGERWLLPRRNRATGLASTAPAIQPELPPVRIPAGRGVS